MSFKTFYGGQFCGGESGFTLQQMGSTLVDSVDGVVGVGSVLGCGRDTGDHITDSPSTSPEPPWPMDHEQK